MLAFESICTCRDHGWRGEAQGQGGEVLTIQASKLTSSKAVSNYEVDVKVVLEE